VRTHLFSHDHGGVSINFRGYVDASRSLWVVNVSVTSRWGAGSGDRIKLYFATRRSEVRVFWVSIASDTNNG
jgi:hypothetical protein